VGPIADGSVYRQDTGEFKLTIRHQTGKRTRSTVRLDQTKTAADPFQPAINKQVLQGIYLVIDRDVTGFTNTETKYAVDALVAWLNASAGANVTKMLGLES
jgi:hypothetical protein